MKERPILFQTEMVKAIISGIKTQTRRVIKSKLAKNPYGEIGDLLYVRETWTKINDYFGDRIYYKANSDDWRATIKWKPSLFMPKKHARIWLEIEDIRRERVQDITEEDALAEGIFWDDDCPQDVSNGYCPGAFDLPSESFAYLWDSINVKRGYGWDTNPEVWVIEFKREFNRS